MRRSDSGRRRNDLGYRVTPMSREMLEGIREIRQKLR